MSVLQAGYGQDEVSRSGREDADG